MEESTAAPARPQELPCERCGSVVRSWTLVQAKTGEAICSTCVSSDAARRRRKLFLVGSVAGLAVLMVALLVTSQVRRLDGPEPDLEELGTLVLARRYNDLEAYCDKEAVEACFEPLSSAYPREAIVGAQSVALMALANAEVTDVNGSTATAVGHWGSIAGASMSVRPIRYEMREVSKGTWVVTAVENPGEVAADYHEWWVAQGQP